MKLQRDYLKDRKLSVFTTTTPLMIFQKEQCDGLRYTTRCNSKYYLTKESQKWFSSRVSTKAVSPQI